MFASLNGHFDVVNRLLECKQIGIGIFYWKTKSKVDVNFQTQVGENVCTSIICFYGISQCILKISLYIICIHVARIDSADNCITRGPFQCGQSIVGVHTN